MKHPLFIALLITASTEFLNPACGASPAHPQHRVPQRPRMQAMPAVNDNSAPGTGDYVGQLQNPQPWPGPRMPLKVFIQPGQGVASYKPQFQSILETALQEWCSGSNGRIVFTTVDQAKGADLQFEWHNKLSKVSIAGEIGETDVTRDEHGIKHSHTNLVTVRPDGKEMTDEKMKQACLHEIGHALGISGHSNDPRDIMSLTYKFVYERQPDGQLLCVSGEPFLTDRDKSTILRIYDDQWLATKPHIDSQAGGSPPADSPEATATSAATDGSATKESPQAKPESDKKPKVETAASALKTRYKTLVNKAIDYLDREDFDDAIGLLQEARSLGDSSAIAEKNLIIAFTKKANKSYLDEDYSTAAENYESALTLREKVNGPGDPKIAETVPALVFSLHKSGRDHDAEKWKHK